MKRNYAMDEIDGWIETTVNLFKRSKLQSFQLALILNVDILLNTTIRSKIINAIFCMESKPCISGTFIIYLFF